jgi:hypothetical protein
METFEYIMLISFFLVVILTFIGVFFNEENDKINEDLYK